MDGELVSRWFNGQQLPDELIKPAKRNAAMTQNPVCNAATTTAITTPTNITALTILALVAKYTFQDGVKSDDDCLANNKGDEPTPSHLIMTVTLETMAMK